ncbi:ATP-dependent DNA helicase [Paenibacillus aquistagni]|uniref:ATP-dependent DNA helicase n=1 Tax=Paenibacillus aquistagni TaxID=1852522 RepID=UPI00145BBEA2|nr:ATP-dependent DNA helicase [Paenibacillus aquistagni]NMM51624.1 ATP-dependent DNA helicase [Paenibacillus aquistagni]
MANYPFEFNPSEPYIKQASDWIADVFYDLLPEAGFEVRDEQIYMAFQLERAYQEKKTILAEAGVGTGKTLVYLLYAISYARYTRKPAVIACADESLIEQLVKSEGDIAKIAQHLNLTVDARLGKSQSQYLCLNKLDTARYGEEERELYRDIYQTLPAFVRQPDTLQSFYPYGDRKDHAHLSDEQWSRIGWDVFQDCLICPQRHRCGQTLSREHYRKSSDLIICSHDFYMEHVWTYESRKRNGQLPLLPEHSSVVFDEGHLLETAAQNALTYQLKHGIFESIITRLLEGEIRESLAVTIDEAIEQSDMLFDTLQRAAVKIEGSDRMEYALSESLKDQVGRFRAVLNTIEEELVYESGTFTLNDYQLKIVEEHLDMMQTALQLFEEPERLITWLREDQDGLALVIMPKKVQEVLKERVFAQQLPIIFSSATMSVDNSFDYMMSGLGLAHSLQFSTASPYDYEQQMKARLYAAYARRDKVMKTIELLHESEGRALILFRSEEDMRQFRQEVEEIDPMLSYPMLYEGTQEISRLIEQFQQEETSVLCAVSLWEGLDIPGPSLSNVILWDLPFPPNDPVFAARRQDAKDAFLEVDMPYMLLRLKQGVGRLIRSSGDSGIVAIFGDELTHNEVRQQVERALPVKGELESC